MNYRLILSEMYIDYIERLNLESNPDKREVYKEVLRDLNLVLEIEPNQISLMQKVSKLISK